MTSPRNYKPRLAVLFLKKIILHLFFADALIVNLVIIIVLTMETAD